MPGAFKLDHLQPIKPLLFPNFYIFFTFILGGQFLLPQRANMEKREISQSQNKMRQRGSCAWGIQTGPFAAHSATFVFKFLQLFHFHTGRPILIHPEHSKWTICSTFSPFWSRNFPPFALSYWGANSYYPRGPIMGKGNSSNFRIG